MQGEEVFCRFGMCERLGDLEMMQCEWKGRLQQVLECVEKSGIKLYNYNGIFYHHVNLYYEVYRKERLFIS